MQLEAVRAPVSWLLWVRELAATWSIDLGALVLAIAAALLAHRLIIRLLGKLIGARHVFLRLLLSRTTGPTRLAMMIFAASVVTQWTAFSPAVVEALARGLLIGFIVLVGWMAIIAIGIAADLYLQRFELAAEDNLVARQHFTQIRMLQRATDSAAVVITAAAVLMTFEPVRQYGVSLFASAGVVGLVVGLAARPVLSNFIAGIQIAMTQPIRLQDAVVVENEFGWIEEIAAAYVVIRLWDRRRMVVPLSYFIEKPFQNWTRKSTELTGGVVIHVDYSAPVDRIRDKLKEIVSLSPLWDRDVVNLQVVDSTEATMQLRALVSARNSSALGDLQAEVREKLIMFLQRDHPAALPRRREEVDLGPAARAGVESDSRLRDTAA